MMGVQMGMMMGQQMMNNTNMAQGMNPGGQNANAGVQGMNTGVQGAGGTAPKFCPNCGTPTNGANFCGNCGQKLV